jgi:hypothetical protein
MNFKREQHADCNFYDRYIYIFSGHITRDNNVYDNDRNCLIERIKFIENGNELNE